MINYTLTVLLLITALLTACSGSTPTGTPVAQPEVLVAAVEAASPPVSTPDPALPTPPPVSDEELLTGPGAGPPELYNVPEEQSKEALAALLKTTPEELDRLNSNLPAVVSKDALVSIPFDFLVTEAETTLQAVAEQTNTPRWILERANPNIDPFEPLEMETLLRMPRLFVTFEVTTLADVAQQLNVDAGQLRTFNAEWANSKTIPADTALVIPF